MKNSRKGEILCLAGILFLGACATGNRPGTEDARLPREQPPAWVLDAEAAYPSEKYLAQKGHGPDREKAELSALEALSRYFVSEVRSATSAARSYTEKDGDVSRSMNVDERVFVQSQTRLFAVRYAGAWRNPAAEEWEALAYIDRAEAWALYEPGLRQKAGLFESAYRAAEAESEALKGLYLYSRCRSLGAELSPLLDFAQILYPKEAARYSGLRRAIANLPQKIDAARGGTRIYLDCPVDFEGALSGSLGRAFGEAGLTIEDDRTAAPVVCAVEVGENAETRELGTFYRPAVKVMLKGKAETLFTWIAAAGRVGARNPDIAKRRAYAALVQKIQESFIADFEKRMNDF